MRANFSRVRVQSSHRHAPLTQVQVGPGSNSPHAHNKDLGAADTQGLIVWVALFAFQRSDPPLEVVIHAVHIFRQRRGDHKTDHHGQGHGPQPALVNQPGGKGSTGHHQGKFGIGKQVGRGQKSGVRAQLGPSQNDQPQQPFNGQHQGQTSHQHQDLPIQRDLGADHQEKADQGQLAETPQVVGHGFGFDVARK